MEHNPQGLLGQAVFNSEDVKLFKFVGGNLFYENRHRIAGWHETLSAAGSGYEQPKSQYGSKSFLQHKKNGPALPVKLSGQLPLAVTNANPWNSPIWPWLGLKALFKDSKVI